MNDFYEIKYSLRFDFSFYRENADLRQDPNRQDHYSRGGAK